MPLIHYAAYIISIDWKERLMKPRILLNTKRRYIAMKRGTFIYIKDGVSRYLQFSLKEPWLKPKRDTILGGTVMLWGWLFFYVGKNTDDLKNEDLKIVDIVRNPQNYRVRMKSRSFTTFVRVYDNEYFNVYAEGKLGRENLKYIIDVLVEDHDKIK